MKKFKKNLKNFKKKFKIFWKWTWNSDSIYSYFSAFLLSIIIIKYLVFPGFGLIFNNDYPFVAVVTGSMEHKIVNGNVCGKRFDKNKNLDFDEWFKICGKYYKEFNLTKKDFKNFEYENGIDIGEVLILWNWINVENIQIGDLLVFKPQDKLKKNLGDLKKGESFFLQTNGPVIHRVINKYYENGKLFFQTKGDHNKNSISDNSRSNIVSRTNFQVLNFDDFETKIPAEDVIGIPILKIPYLGYPRIILSRMLGQTH